MAEIPSYTSQRERFLYEGASTFSDAELLAILTNLLENDEASLARAKHLLKHFGGLKGLKNISAHELQQLEGIDADYAASILVIIELWNRLLQSNQQEIPYIKSAADAAKLLWDMHHLTQEHVRVILLDVSSRVMSIVTIYVGTLKNSVVRVSEVYKDAIKQGSAGIILAHNHPGGIAQPTPEDVTLSRDLVSAGKLLDIAFVDHIIIAPNEWVSLKNLGLL